MDKTDTEYRKADNQTLYLERVEAAAMDQLVKAINDGKMTLAFDLVRLMSQLQIV